MSKYSDISNADTFACFPAFAGVHAAVNVLPVVVFLCQLFTSIYKSGKVIVCK